jgi:hypothetical protein
MPGIRTVYSTRNGIFYCDLFHCGKASNFGLLQIWDVKYIISSLTFESQLKTLFLMLVLCVVKCFMFIAEQEVVLLHILQDDSNN